MILSKKNILSRIKGKEIIFTPQIDGFQLQPHSVDLRIGYSFHIPRTWQLTPEGRKALNVDPLQAKVNNEYFDEITLKPKQYFELLPNEYIIATTMEKLELKCLDIMAVLYPRSSVNRRGLAVDLSGIIDVGYCGHLMIPLVNNTQQQIIRIYPGERVCQIVFQMISEKVDKNDALLHGLHKAKYHNNKTGFIGGRSDRNDEVDFIKSGKIKDLKKKYGLKL